MAISFTTVSDRDFGGGIDAQSTENAIREGYVESLQNIDPHPMGHLKTRKGYQGVAGNIPARVKRVEYSTAATDNLCFVLDGSIDLSEIRSTPIIAYGNTSALNALNEGDFPRIPTVGLGLQAAYTVLGSSIIAGTDTINRAGHTLVNGDAVVMRPQSTALSGITAGQVYYVVSAVAGVSFKISTTSGGAAADITGAAATEYYYFQPTGLNTFSDVFTVPAHGFRNGDAVTISGTGVIPTGLSVGTSYYVISATANSFQLSATSGGSAINTSYTALATGIGEIYFHPSTTPSVHYYNEFVADIRKTINIGVNTLSIPFAEHGISSNVLWVQPTESTNTVINDNSHFGVDSITINKTSYDLSVGYTNSNPAFQSFIIYKDRTSESGVVYNGNTTTASTTESLISQPAAHSRVIPFSVHGLINRNLLVKVYKDTGTVHEEIQAENIYIDDSTGDVTVEIINHTGSAIDVFYSIVSAPTANFKTGSIGYAGGATVATVITLDIGANPFLFTGCYLKSGTTLELVSPDSVVIDTALQTATITLQTNPPPAGYLFYVFWDYATVATNKLCVTAPVISTAFTDTAPQIVIYGLDHLTLYGVDKSGREGWTNHIDSYRSLGENRLISGLGGNLYRRIEAEEDSEALMDTIYPRLQATTSGAIVLSPVFHEPLETPSRTGGYVTGTVTGTNQINIDSIAYNSGTTYVEYTLTSTDAFALYNASDVLQAYTQPNLDIIINTAAGLSDRLTVSQCGWNVHNGTYIIKSATIISTTSIKIAVENTAVTSVDFDELNAGGAAGIFTQRLTFSGSVLPPFMTDDYLLCGLFTDVNIVRTLSSKLDGGVPTTLVNGIDATISLPGGLKFLGRRTSSTVPLRISTGTAAVTNLVAGDMLRYSTIDRLVRINSINQLTDTIISDIDDTGVTATVTISGQTTHTLRIGQVLHFTGTEHYNGQRTITEILSDTVFTIDGVGVYTNDSGTIVGNTIEIDESLTFEDTENNATYFTVDSRWFPIEIPYNDFNLTPKTQVTHWDSQTYSNQDILRSTMVQDNMYIVGSNDVVMKYDGSSLYRAGVPRWQTQVFATTTTVGTGTILNNNKSITWATALVAADRTAGRIQLDTVNDVDTIPVGSQVKISNTTGNIYTVKSYKTGTPNYVVLDKAIDSADPSTGTIRTFSRVRYYFRMNVVDANNNVITSAVVGSFDNYVELSGKVAVQLRLVGLPTFDNYDYDRLEVQIYRTKIGEIAPFYLVSTLPMSFNNNDGYLDYRDTTSDDELFELDGTVSSLFGQQIPTGWAEPLRAKHVTSAGNRLILANVTDYAQLDIRTVQNRTLLESAVFTNTSNNTWLIRKDNTDTGTTTDVVNRINYEFKDVTTGSTLSGDPTHFPDRFVFHLSGSTSQVAGNWVYLFHDTTTTTPDMTYAGWWQIAEVTSGTFSSFTIRAVLPTPNGLGIHATKSLFSTVAGNVPVPIGQVYDYGQVNGNRATTGVDYSFIAMRRLSDSINASMRKVDTSISGMANFKPWMIANAGNEFNAGQIILRNPTDATTFLEVKIPPLSGAFDVYVNDSRRAGNTEASAVALQFPSRVLISYPNFSEIFDNPTSVLDTESQSAIDVNSADGQEITAVIPFFGESAFGAAQKGGVVVVFKTNSIYLIDVASKTVQKLDSRGKGCTAPASVASTRSGIMFANETGIYKLTQQLTVDYVGRTYERIWNTDSNKNQVSLASGHHDPNSNAYKLSYPTIGTNVNANVAVYNHTREYESQASQGSWTKYTNHPVTGWANLVADSYFASDRGRVYSIRKLDEVADYRDDSGIIDVEVITRAQDFGNSGIRKMVGSVTTHFRVETDSLNTTMEAATDMSETFDELDTFDIKAQSSSTGIGDSDIKKVVIIQSSIPKKRATYFQMKYLNASKDEPISITRIDYYVGGLSPAGVKQAKETET